MKKCPFCAEEIQEEAVKCRFCGEFLDKKSQAKWYFKTPVILLLFFCVGPFVLPLIWLNPRYSIVQKFLASALVVIVSYYIFTALNHSLQTISQYYQLIFGNSRGNL